MPPAIIKMYYAALCNSPRGKAWCPTNRNLTQLQSSAIWMRTSTTRVRNELAAYSYRQNVQPGCVKTVTIHHCLNCRNVVKSSYPGGVCLLHKIGMQSTKNKGGKFRPAHGAAVWRPVVKHPEFCFPECKSVRERLGTLRVGKLWQLYP